MLTYSPMVTFDLFCETLQSDNGDLILKQLVW